MAFHVICDKCGKEFLGGRSLIMKEIKELGMFSNADLSIDARSDLCYRCLIKELRQFISVFDVMASKYMGNDES
jgi:hypothetical protein